jgi:hypothetical protein
VPDIVEYNAEAYGDRSYNVPCVHCKNMIYVIVERQVKITNITKSNAKQSDFASSQGEA